MNPLLNILLAGLVMPLDPATAAAYSQLQSNPKYSGIANAAQAHPKTVELKQDPALSREGLQGQWNMGQGKDNIRLNPKSGLDTLVHELTHFLVGNSAYNQTMQPAKQETVSQAFGDYGNKVPSLGGELESIYRALVGSPAPTATGGGTIKEQPTANGVRSFTNY